MIHDEHTIQRPFAVVTSATEWFGSELAKQFASKGFDLLITSKDDTVHGIRDELLKYGVFVESYVLDLSTYKGVETLRENIKSFGHPIDALAFYADEGPDGPFLETDIGSEFAIIRQNILGPVHLLKGILKEMVERGHGRVLISSALGPTNEAPYEAVYGASKSFLFSFTEALRSEIRNSGVTLTTSLPNLYEVPTESELKAMEDPEELARESFDALMAGRDYVFEATFKTKLQGIFSRLIPDKARAFIAHTPS
ncbi:MAG TPA: SDR family NAD(P)-dependent oxidoreductase [Bacteriovoracaceae bacterium]|nr:SDR family NAD(P)-dependent oxidoreductase [Bacteriovoracaceae bacterium]